MRKAAEDTGARAGADLLILLSLSHMTWSVLRIAWLANYPCVSTGILTVIGDVGWNLDKDGSMP